MGNARAVWVASVGLLLAAMPVAAHHSFKAEYESDHTTTLKGTVTKISWENPHVLCHLDVKEENGQPVKKAASWELELGSPNLLLSQGWKLSSLKTGDEVVVEGYRARNGVLILNARKITLSAH
ncbi:MAG: hypothetical protein LAP40_28310 [Acidobacteriia bacterium]|nr:hypothetical protein [Terriglobia bacterium]